MIRIVSHQRRQIKCHRQPVLPLTQQEVITLDWSARVSPYRKTAALSRVCRDTSTDARRACMGIRPGNPMSCRKSMFSVSAGVYRGLTGSEETVTYFLSLFVVASAAAFHSRTLSSAPRQTAAQISLPDFVFLPSVVFLPIATRRSRLAGSATGSTTCESSDRKSYPRRCTDPIRRWPIAG